MQNTYTNIGLFILRLWVAAVFIPSGFGKLIDLKGTAGMFESLGLVAPMVFALGLALVELVAGVAVLFGVYTRIAAGLLAAVMIGAIVLVHGPQHGFGTETQFVTSVLAINAALVLIGAGAIKLRFAVRGNTAKQDAASGMSSESGHVAEGSKEE